MKSKKIVIIGGDAAGMSAASQVKRLQPDWEVIVFEKNNYISYAACGMPYFIKGDIPSIDNLIQMTPKKARESRNIDLRVESTVVEIDPEKKEVTVENSNGKFNESFDCLLIATGSSPLMSSIDFQPSSRILSLRGLEDASEIDAFIGREKPQKCAVIGGGYISVEMVEAFQGRGLETHLIHRRKDLARTFEVEVSDKIKAEMENKGVILQLERSIINLKEKDDKIIVVTEEGDLEYDFVFLGLGVAPNTELARECGLDLGIKGAIKVDKHLQTKYDYIYAAGDCVEAVHKVNGKNVYTPLALKANREGMIAGQNLAGVKEKFSGVMGTAICKIFDLGVSRTGLTLREAQESGFDAIKFDISSKNKAGYYPGSRDIYSLVVIDKKSGQVLGAQLAGPIDGVKRIDTYVTAIENKMTLDDIFNLDLAYAPPFSALYDPVLMAARVGKKQVEK